MKAAAGPWGNRDFRLLWAGNGISQLGTNGARIAYPLLALAVTGSPVVAGWAGFAGSLPNILLQLPAGVVADRRNRRTTMLICQAGGALTALALLLLGMLGAPGFLAALIVLAFAEGCFYVFFDLAELGAVRDVVTVEQRPAAISLHEAQTHATVLVSRALGVLMFGLMQWLPFLVNLGSYLVSVMTVAGVNGRATEPLARDSGSEGGARGGMRYGLVWLWRNPFLRTVNMLFGATNVIWQCVILLFIVTAHQQHQPPWLLGAVLAGSGIGGLAGSAAAPRLARGRCVRTVFIAALWSWTALITVIAAAGDPFVQAGAWFGVGATGAAAAISVSVYEVNAVPAAALGRVAGATQILPRGAIPVGAVLGGYLLAALGVRATAWTLVASMLILALCGTALLPGAASPGPVRPPGDRQERDPQRLGS